MHLVTTLSEELFGLNLAPTLSINGMPGLAVQTIVGYANGSLGETSKAMRTAIPAHYKVNMMARAVAFGSHKDPQGLLLNQHMGLQPGGTPLAPRAITKITVTGCSDRNDTDGGYQRLEEAIKRVVVHSATSLRSISVTGRGCSRDNKTVFATLEALVYYLPLTLRMARAISHVTVAHSQRALIAASRALKSNIWPGLEELILRNTRAQHNAVTPLVYGLRQGNAPFLRVLDWGGQSRTTACIGNYVLSALSAGPMRPRIEVLNFNNNCTFFDEKLSNLRGALRACPGLLELRMDSTTTPSDQLGDLTLALEAGDVPRLRSLYVRVPVSTENRERVASIGEGLVKAADLRGVCLEIDYKPFGPGHPAFFAFG
ncbi:unnamed protein product [Ectocarpus sp. 12 AP-2014]